MALTDSIDDKWRKFLLPGAASVLGAGAGLVLTRSRKLGDSLPSLNDVGIGDLADDLRSKVSSVVGKGNGNGNGGGNGSGNSSRSRARTLDPDELEQRLRRRAERRKQRAGR
jgi:hypothetical protein